MVNRRLFLIFLAVVLFVTVLHAERARNDNLQDAEEEIDFSNDNNDGAEDVIETIKRFLRGKKTTTPKPSSDSISALLTTTRASKLLSTSTSSSVIGDMFGKKSSIKDISSTRYSGVSRATTASPKDACGMTNPCKNGGSCKTLSSGRYYCFCGQDYYGKNCENKFTSTGAANNDRSRKDHCEKSPCRNAAECVSLRTTYYCRCKSPFYGTNCDKSIGVGKREEHIDESISSEQDLNVYERELQEDAEDLRRAIADENVLENMQ